MNSVNDIPIPPPPFIIIMLICSFFSPTQFSDVDPDSLDVVE